MDLPEHNHNREGYMNAAKVYESFKAALDALGLGWNQKDKMTIKVTTEFIFYESTETGKAFIDHTRNLR